MTRKLDSKKPPFLAAWTVNLFAPAAQAESILGDLHEEFSQIGSRLGADVARKWYWHQSWRTIAHLAGSGLCDAPWSTAAAVIVGFLLLRFAHGLPGKILTVVTDKYLMYWSNHFQAYRWVLKALPIEYLLGSALVGCLVALAAKGREMVATMTLGLILFAMAAVGTLRAVTVTADASYFWNLPLQFADPIAIVIGGIILRTRRAASRILPSA
jgi:hypothetical protein